MKRKAIAVSLIVPVALVVYAIYCNATWSAEKKFMFDCHEQGRGSNECGISWEAHKGAL